MNVLTNGDFSDGGTGWTLAGAVVTAGVLIVTSGTRFAAQSNVLVAGRSYSVSFSAKRNSVETGLRINSRAGNGDETLLLFTPEQMPLGTTVQLTGTFTASDTYFAIEAAYAALFGEIDNVVVTEI